MTAPPHALWTVIEYGTYAVLRRPDGQPAGRIHVIAEAHAIADTLNDRPACATVAAVREDLARRAELGLRKYGVTVADNPLSVKEWNQHFYEELLDAVVYLKRIMEADNAR